MIRCLLDDLMGEHMLYIAGEVRNAGLSRNTIARLYQKPAQKINPAAVDSLRKIFNRRASVLLEAV